MLLKLFVFVSSFRKINDNESVLLRVIEVFFSDVGNGGSFDRRFLRRRLHRRRKSDSSWFSSSSLASGALVPQKKTNDACDEMKSRANNNNNNTNNKYTISRVLRRGENERRKRAALF